MLWLRIDDPIAIEPFLLIARDRETSCWQGGRLGRVGRASDSRLRNLFLTLLDVLSSFPLFCPGGKPYLFAEIGCRPDRTRCFALRRLPLCSRWLPRGCQLARTLCPFSGPTSSNRSGRRGRLYPFSPNANKR